MRKWTWTLAAALACAAPLHAQAPGAPAAPATATLDTHLNSWEQKMKAVESLVGPCARTEVDKTFQTTKVYEGTAQFLKPGMAILDLKNKQKPELFEKYICTGTFLYEYAPANKTIRVHELPQTKPGQPDDNFLSFLFGMKAEDAKKRYDLKMSKEDQYYVYVDIVPKLPADKVDFARAQLVLTKGTYLPRRLWFEQPNGNEVTWDLPKTEMNVRIDRTLFTAPQAPAGWTLDRVPKPTEGKPATPPAPSPKVFRPQSPN
jgi:TIGR03009 family protein